MIHATMVCNSFSQREKIERELKPLQGVTVHACSLAIGVDYEAPDTATDVEIDHTTARLLDIVESVEIHGVVIS